MSDRTPDKETEMANDEPPRTLAQEAPEDAPADIGGYDEGPPELPRRPRRRLLTPLTLALAAALMVAVGFIGGVEVQKGQTSSSAGGAGGSFASRLQALRGGRSTGAAGAGAGAFGGGAGFGGVEFGAGGAGGGLADGEVAYIHGSTLYVTTSEGNTVKVTTSGARVTKSVSVRVGSIHPGDTVLVRGATGPNGSLQASTIVLGAANAASATSRSASGAASGGTPQLFGSGG